jgi:hypothetical protein
MRLVMRVESKDHDRATDIASVRLQVVLEQSGKVLNAASMDASGKLVLDHVLPAVADTLEVGQEFTVELTPSNG